MTRYAIGDIQGCYDELRTLLQRIRFSADRDQLWFVGDLVNRGPKSLETLRFVRDLGDNAITVLGNHDLHLLALALGGRDKPKSGDTLNPVLEAPDRDQLIEWLLHRPLAHHAASQRDLLLHAALIPPWTVDTALTLAREVQKVLRDDPRKLFQNMYGNSPDEWSDSLKGMDRLRFTINVFTRMRVCTAEGRIDLKMKGGPNKAKAPFRPWFEFDQRKSRETRLIFGHWSALGFVNDHGVVGLDTGCVWGNALTAFDLDDERAPISLKCAGYQDVSD
jgi:bis(5'-nucleosyl)-tetraphosphatase (symmetrical)